jgi:hypothetical protein
MTPELLHFLLFAAALAPIIGRIMYVIRFQPALAIIKDRAEIGGPRLYQKIRESFDKEYVAPVLGLAALVTDEDLPSVRMSVDYKEYAKEDDTPIFQKFPRINARKATRYCNIAIAPIIAISWFVPILGIILALTWLGLQQHTQKTAKADFTEVWNARQEIVLKAGYTVEPYIRTGRMGPTNGMAKYEAHKWIGVPEWNRTFPTSFRITVPIDFTPNDSARKALMDSWEEKMSRRGEVSWAWEWNMSEGFITAKLFAAMPTKVDLPFPADPELPWNMIPLGIGTRGNVIYWNAKEKPSLLIMGRIGEGKSIQLNAILLHMLQNQFWSVYIADRKGALSTYMKSDGCKGFETSPESILDLLRDIYAENERRKKILDENGKRKWYDLPEKIRIDGELVDRPPMIFLVVEEAIDLLSSQGMVGEEKAMALEMRSLITKIIVTSRSQGIQLGIIIQQPYAEYIGGTVRDNIGCRIQVGPMGDTYSRMLFESEVPDRHFVQDVGVDDLGEPVSKKGRAAYQFGAGEPKIMQGFFSEDDDEPLTRRLQQCNRVRSGKRSAFTRTGGARHNAQGAHSAHNMVEGLEESLEKSHFLNKLFNRFDVELYMEVSTVIDEEEGVEVERESLRFRRIQTDSEVEDDSERDNVRPAPRQLENHDEGKRERVQERLRERREQLRREREESSTSFDDGRPSPAGLTSGLPVAVFADQVIDTPETMVSVNEAVTKESPTFESPIVETPIFKDLAVETPIFEDLTGGIPLEDSFFQGESVEPVAVDVYVPALEQSFALQVASESPAVDDPEEPWF